MASQKKDSIQRYIIWKEANAAAVMGEKGRSHLFRSGSVRVHKLIVTTCIYIYNAYVTCARALSPLSTPTPPSQPIGLYNFFSSLSLSLYFFLLFSYHSLSLFLSASFFFINLPLPLIYTRSLCVVGGKALDGWNGWNGWGREKNLLPLFFSSFPFCVRMIIWWWWKNGAGAERMTFDVGATQSEKSIYQTLIFCL